MATPGAFPPTPQQAQPQPNPIGQALSSAQPQMGGLIQQVVSAIKTLGMFTQAVAKTHPQAAQKFQNGIRMFFDGIKDLRGGQTSAAGSVPPPPQMAAESPSQGAETPEAT